MLRKKIRLIVPALLILLTNTRIFSQKVQLSDNGDTLVCFSINQSKYLLKKYYELQELKSLYSICNQQLTASDSIKKYFYEISNSKDIILKNQKTEIGLREEQIEHLKVELQLEKKETDRQKRHKNFAIAGGVLSSCLFGYLWITK